MLELKTVVVVDVRESTINGYNNFNDPCLIVGTEMCTIAIISICVGQLNNQY